MNKITGIAASDGYAIARAFLLEQPDLTFEETKSDQPEVEVDRLNKALEESREEITKIREIAKGRLSAEEAEVFNAHLQMLDDPEMISAYQQKINDEGLNAQAAVRQTADFFITIFKSMEDNPYMQERAADVKDVTDRLIAHLIGAKCLTSA